MSALARPGDCSEAPELGAWLSTPEPALLLGWADSTLSGWLSGHSPRPGFELERRKDCASVWWRAIVYVSKQQG